MARSIVGGFLSIFGSRVATFLVMLVSTPFVVRALGPAGYGNYQYLLSLFTLLMIFVSSGVSEGVQKFISERDRGDDWQSNVVGFYLKVATALAVGGAAVFGVAGLTGIGGVPPWHFFMLVVLVFAAQYRELARRIIMGLGYEEYSEPLMVLNGVLQPGIALALLYGLDWGADPALGVAAMLVGYIVGGVVVTVVGGWFIRKQVSVRAVLSRTPAAVPKRELLSFNLLTIVLILLLTSLYKVDVILIKTLLGPEKTGYYSAALALAEYLWFVPMSLQALFIHSTSSLWSEGKVETINRLTSRTTRYVLLLTLVMSIGIAALADRFIPLYYGEDFVRATRPLLVLLPGALAFAVARPVFSTGQGSGNIRPLIAGTGAAALINLVLNVLLIPRFGLIGAAFSTSVGYASMLVFHVWSARRIGFDPIQDLRIARVAAAGVVAAVPIFALSNAIEVQHVTWLAGFPLAGSIETQKLADIVALAVVPVVGLVVFALAVLATGAMSLDETLEILSSFPAPVGPRASAYRSRLSGSDLEDDVTPKILTLAGILLFVVGVALTAGAVFSGSVGPDDIGPANGTTPAPGGGTPVGDSPTGPADTPTAAGDDGGADGGNGDSGEGGADDGGGGDDGAGTGGDRTPTDAPDGTQTDAPDGSPTDAPTETPTDSPSETPTEATPGESTPTGTETETGTATPTGTGTATPSGTATGTGTATPIGTSTPVGTSDGNETGTVTTTSG